MWTIGTPTFRCRHEVIVNLPAVIASTKEISVKARLSSRAVTTQDIGVALMLITENNFTSEVAVANIMTETPKLIARAISTDDHVTGLCDE